MKQEEAEKKLDNHPKIEYFIFGITPDDGNFRLDAAACISREDARNESKKFIKFNLYKLELDKNQNL